MLKVFLHNAAPGGTTQFNSLGRLDIAYERLDIVADYKACLTVAGRGDLPLVFVKEYPRWTASIWDLVTRAICMSLYGDERLPEIAHSRRGAFAEMLTAV